MLNSVRAKNPNPTTKAFAKILIDLLDERFPKCGSANCHYAAATIVHPFYQGMALYDLGTHAATVAQFLKDNDNTQEDLDMAQVAEDFDDDDMSIEAATQRARNQMRLGAGLIRNFYMQIRSLANTLLV